MGAINVSLPDSLVDRIDDLVKGMGYATRSELVREALRSFLVELERVSKLRGQFLAVVTMTFNIDRRGVSEEVNKIQHKYESVILTTLHNHVGRVCLEVILTNGDIGQIKRFVEELKVVRGVETAKISVALTFSKVQST